MYIIRALWQMLFPNNQHCFCLLSLVAIVCSYAASDQRPVPLHAAQFTVPLLMDANIVHRPSEPSLLV